MSEENDDLDALDEIEDGAKKKVSGKKLVLFIVLPVLLLIGVGAGLFMSGLLDPLLGLNGEETAGEAMEQEIDTGPGHFLELDEMTVTLRSTGGRQMFLKVQITLELESQSDEARIQQVQPRITENFLLFLRELRVEELEGSEGAYRIQEELMRRVNRAAHPVKVKDVLITNLLIQ